MTGLGKVSLAENLKRIGANKIIITIRNQATLLDSIYRQYIQEGGVASFDFFIKEWRFSFNLKHLNFYRIIKFYKNLFGEENVLVLLNEELYKNEQETIKKIEDFTSSKYEPNKEKLNPKTANISITNCSVKLLRFVNHFIRSHHRPSNFLLPHFVRTFYFRYLLQRFLDPYLLAKICKKKSFLNKKNMKIIQERYKEDNRKLIRKYGLKLEEHGYPI